jgi:hypothetical protein
MRNSRLLAVAAAILGLVATLQPAAAGAGGPDSFAAAQDLATKEGRPVLLKFSTEW